MKFRYSVICICLSSDVIEGIPHDTGLLQYVMHMLATEDIEGLPPGGGINAKYVELYHIAVAALVFVDHYYLIFPQCFETVDWMSGKTTSLYKQKSSSPVIPRGLLGLFMTFY